MDRIEAAIERGLIQHCPDEMPCEFLDFTTAELAKLYEILLPEEFFEPKKARRATRDTAPASPERIAVYAERQAAGQSITAAGDVGAVRRDGKQLRIAERKNGSGVRVVGWEE